MHIWDLRMPKVPIKELPGHTHWYLLIVLLWALTHTTIFVVHNTMFAIIIFLCRCLIVKFF